MDPLTSISTRRTPQHERAIPNQVKNAAGGYVFQISDLAALRRFLTLGTDGGTYYTSAQELTKEQAGIVLRLAETDHAALVADRAATDHFMRLVGAMVAGPARPTSWATTLATMKA